MQCTQDIRPVPQRLLERADEDPRVRGDRAYRITGNVASSHGCVISECEGDSLEGTVNGRKIRKAGSSCN